MDFKRIKILTVSLLLFMLCFWFPPLSILADSRAITVIGNLNHKSGKLGAYRALIIGINDYQDPKIPDLKTAVNDAKAMSELLEKRYGFKVKLLLNRDATKEAIYQALRSLASSTKPDDSVLIYYAGHGDLDRTFNDGWWIPVDAKGGNPLTYLDNIQVQKAMSSMQARHVLLISDSCYAGTLFGEARAMPPVIDDKYYLNLYNEKSRWGMTSGNRTPVEDRGSGGHSVFAYQLLKELRQNEQPYISTQEIFIRIAPIVGNNSDQTPLCRPIRNTGDQGGEFIFVASSGASAIAVASVKADDTGLQKERKRLEQERKELEKIKAEVAERKKIEEERLRIEAKKKQLLATPDRFVFEDEPPLRIEAEKKQLLATPRLTLDLFADQFSEKSKKITSDYFKEWNDDPEFQKLPVSEKAEIYTNFFDKHMADDEFRSLPEPRQAKIKANFLSAVGLATHSGFGEKEIARDGTLIAYASGVVYDKKTGLEWYAGPDRDTNWNEAKAWVESLKVAGGGWRMPTKEELKTLYHKGAGTRNMTHLLKTTGWWVWSGETSDSSSAWLFFFTTGSENWFNRDFSSPEGRAFAVRSHRQ